MGKSRAVNLPSSLCCRLTAVAVQLRDLVRLPQVSFTMAMVEPVTFIGGIVNSPPPPLSARSRAGRRP